MVLKGAARLEFEGRVLEMEAGDWITILAHKKHRRAWTPPMSRWSGWRFSRVSEAGLVGVRATTDALWPSLCERPLSSLERQRRNLRMLG